MKRLIALAILLTTLGCSSQHKENDANDRKHHHEHYQGKHDQHHSSQAGAELIVATDPEDPIAGHPVTLKLMIHAADGTMVKDFDVVHEEKVHLVIVRDGLDHFAHIHPAADAKGNLTVSHTFPVGHGYGGRQMATGPVPSY